MTLSTETIPYSNGLRLLIVHIRPKNIGKVLFEPGSKGFHLFVKKLPKDPPYGQLLEPTTGKPFKEIDILRHDKGGYELEPGVEYDETETLVVSKGDNFYLETELWWPNNDDFVNNKKIVRVE